MSEIAVEKFVGIDVSKSTLDVFIDPINEELHVDYDDKGIAKTVKRLLELTPALVVIEATD